MYKLYFHSGPLKTPNLETIRFKTDAKSLKKWSPIILRLFKNIDIKHYNIMNSKFRSVGKLFQTIGVRWDKFFWPEHVFLKWCFSFKTEDLVFAWFWPDRLYILWNYKGQVSLKNLKALTKVLIKSFRNQEPVNFFKVFHSNVTSVI